MALDGAAQLSGGGFHGHEAGLGRQQPDDQGEQGEADEADAEEGVLPVTESAGQQTADHPACDAPQGVGGDVDPDRREQGSLAELFPHVGDGCGWQPRQQHPLQDAQAHQQIEPGHPGDA